MHRLLHALAPATGILYLLQAASAYAADAPGWQPSPDWLIYLVLASLLVGLLAVFAATARALRDTRWSFADALSEEADLTANDSAGMPYTVNGAVVKESVLRASSSRLIAFLGTIAILALFLGFGTFILWNFARTGNMQGAGEVRDFLLGGLGLFAPYVVNKFSSVFAPK